MKNDRNTAVYKQTHQSQAQSPKPILLRMLVNQKLLLLNWLRTTMSCAEKTIVPSGLRISLLADRNGILSYNSSFSFVSSRSKRMIQYPF